jgi:hypothetical protein
MELTRCIECRSDRLVSSVEKETRIVDGRTFTADLPGQKSAEAIALDVREYIVRDEMAS